MKKVSASLPDDVLLEEARQRADEEQRNLSVWSSALVQGATAAGWTESLVDLLHNGSGDIVEPDDPQPGDLNLFR